MSKVIMLNVCKGGTGKTTITTQLAGVYAKRGLKVAVIDGDRTASLMKFIYNRNKQIEDGVDLPYIKGEWHDPDQNIRKNIKELKTDFDIILIDTMGGQSELFRTAIQIADVVLVPLDTDIKAFDQLQPTFSVINGVEKNIQAVEGWEDHTVDVRVCLNKVKKRSKSFNAALEMKRHFSISADFTKTAIPAMEVVQDFDDYRTGVTLADLKHPKRAVFELLADELLVPAAVASVE
jgi:cellulose biosynthesis protein BcsQ